MVQTRTVAFHRHIVVGIGNVVTVDTCIVTVQIDTIVRNGICRTAVCRSQIDLSNTTLSEDIASEGKNRKNNEDLFHDRILFYY